jgi:hypothetical protein
LIYEGATGHVPLHLVAVYGSSIASLTHLYFAFIVCGIRLDLLLPVNPTFWQLNEFGWFTEGASEELWNRLVSLGGGEPNHWNSPPVTDHYSSQEVQKCLHANSVQWTFKPPRTLNFGGAHEPLVQSTKRALFNPLDQEKEDFRNPTEDVLRTLLYEMAGLLNTRPQVPIQLISVR